MALLAAYLLLVSCVAYSLDLKMEAVHLSEKSANLYRPTRRYTQKIVLFAHRCEKLSSSTGILDLVWR
jgi:hypothetical protein